MAGYNEQKKIILEAFKWIGDSTVDEVWAYLGNQTKLANTN